MDLYFAKEVNSMSEQQRNSVPTNLLLKVFNRAGRYLHLATTRLGFLAKLLILVTGLRKRVYIVIEDEYGETVEEFSKLKKDLKTRKVTEEHNGIISGTFVMGGIELIKTLDFMADVSSSRMYNYLMKIKNAPKNKIAEWSDHMDYITKFLTRYEGNKKKWMAETGLNIQEFMMLLALYNGEEAVGVDIIRGTYKNSLYTGSTRMKKAFGTLQAKKYMIKYGVSRGAKMRITPNGREVISRILLKIA